MECGSSEAKSHLRSKIRMCLFDTKNNGFWATSKSCETHSIQFSVLKRDNMTLVNHKQTVLLPDNAAILRSNDQVLSISFQEVPQVPRLRHLEDQPGEERNTWNELSVIVIQ